MEKFAFVLSEESQQGKKEAGKKGQPKKIEVPIGIFAEVNGRLGIPNCMAIVSKIVTLAKKSRK